MSDRDVGGRLTVLAPLTIEGGARATSRRRHPHRDGFERPGQRRRLPPGDSPVAVARCGALAPGGVEPGDVSWRPRSVGPDGRCRLLVRAAGGDLRQLGVGACTTGRWSARARGPRGRARVAGVGAVAADMECSGPSGRQGPPAVLRIAVDTRAQLGANLDTATGATYRSLKRGGAAGRMGPPAGRYR
jgi:hypothetical protein